MPRFFPKTWMEAFTLFLAAAWGAKLFFASSGAYRPSPWLGFVLDLLPLLFAIPAAYYLYRIVRYARTRLLWKISRRLILAHIFIGAIPVVFVIGIFYFSIVLFYYQLSYFLIFNQIGIHAARIHAYTMSLRDEIQQIMTESVPPDDDAIKKILDDNARYLLSSYPSATILLSLADANAGSPTVYSNQNSISTRLNGYDIPAWTRDAEFNGLIMEDRAAKQDAARLLFRSFIPNTFQSKRPFYLEVTIPFDGYFLSRLKSALGQDMVLARQTEPNGMNIILPLAAIAPENILETTFSDNTASAMPWMWPIRLYPVSWSSGAELNPYRTDALMVEVSIPKLIQNLLRSENKEGKSIYQYLEIVVVIFLIAEMASILIGIILTRSITSAVRNLDLGTQYVKRGDFSHRIIVRSRDQLGALAASFNQMTEYVQHLIKESVQKERLEREIEIAREVQERLFPSRPPGMQHLDVAGICLPARSVSGDYYDFLTLGKNALGLAIGDICGKGIYAALLMANMQATLRSNVMNSWTQAEPEKENTIADIVERMNAQIFSYTNDNKFATFFYAVYDDMRKTLSYCNAGHNPPLLFIGEEIRRLTTGGTVIGIFADSRYEQETVSLPAGAIFAAYTDGITESVNEYGEEFGEARFIRLIQDHRELSVEDIKEKVIQTVLSWKYGDEQDDDMTLIIAKVLP